MTKPTSGEIQRFLYGTKEETLRVMVIQLISHEGSKEYLIKCIEEFNKLYYLPNAK